MAHAWNSSASYQRPSSAWRGTSDMCRTLKACANISLPSYLKTFAELEVGAVEWSSRSASCVRIGLHVCKGLSSVVELGSLSFKSFPRSECNGFCLVSARISAKSANNSWRCNFHEYRVHPRRSHHSQFGRSTFTICCDRLAYLWVSETAASDGWSSPRPWS